jgi:hypothetical protein
LSFLDLPPEIWNKIYHTLLTIRTKKGEPKVLSMDEFRLRFRMLPSVLLRNNQIISEAKPVFVGANILHLKGRRFEILGNLAICRELPEVRSQTSHHAPGKCPQGRIQLPSRVATGCGTSTFEAGQQYAVRSALVDFTESVLGRAVAEDEHTWEAEDIDWLYPVQEMKRFGFTRFERLYIKIVYPDYKSVEMENEFRAWVKEHINIMAEVKELEILFCRARYE